MGAHINIQKVTESGWEMYLAKYVAKGEPSFKLQISKDVSEPEKYLQTRVVGRVEVDHINLGYFLCYSSRVVTYLPTDLNPQYGFLTCNEHLPADPQSDNVSYSNMLDKYMERPTELENVLYVDWADSARIYHNVNGRQWKKCKTEAVAIWTFVMLNRDKQEEYYMQTLVLNVPLHKDKPCCPIATNPVHIWRNVRLGKYYPKEMIH